jgi:hypothetical protein
LVYARFQEELTFGSEVTEEEKHTDTQICGYDDTMKGENKK